MWLDSLRRLIEGRQRKRDSRSRPRTVRPRRRSPPLSLESLEDRMVLSTLMVANLNDSANFKPGDGSLRGEIAAANNGDTIQFASSLAGKTINFTAGELLLSKNLSIIGPNTAGAPGITINAGGASRVFDIEGGRGGISVTLQNLTVTGGAANKGAGLFINDKAGTVTLNNLDITSNHATGAAGANAPPPGTNTPAQLGSSGQAGLGGGIYFAGGSAGTLVIFNSTLQSNVAAGGSGGQGGFGGLDFSGTGSGTGSGGTGGEGGSAEGGGLYVNGGSLQLSDDTILNNSALGGQGGLGGAGGVSASNHNAFGGEGGFGGFAYGGGLYLSGGGSAQLSGVVIKDNIAHADNGGIGGAGGHVEPSAPVGTVFNGSGGYAFGGGVFATGGSLQVSTATIQNNAATGGSNPMSNAATNQAIVGGLATGGGLYVSNGSLVISSSTLDGDAAKGGAANFIPGRAIGGAVLFVGGQAQLLNDTLAFNSTTSGSASRADNGGAASLGSAVAQVGSAFPGPSDLRLINDTIAKNSALLGHGANGTPFGLAGGAVYNTGGTANSLEITNTILAFNTAANPSVNNSPEIFGPITSSSHDLIDNDNDSAPNALAGFTPGPGDLIGVTPNLAPLGNHGGPTQTMPLLPGSPGMDAGVNSLQGPASIPGLVDWWRGEGNANDSAGTNNGILNGGTGNAPGVSGSAFNFNSPGSYVDFGTGPDIVGTGAFTIGVWIRTTSDGTIISQRDINNFNGEYALAVVKGKINWFTYGNNQYGFDINSNQSVNDGKWHFITVTRLTNGAGQIYIDGKLDSSSTASTAVPLIGGVHVYLGEDVRDAFYSGPSGADNFVGQIDEVQIYNGALSASEIQSLATPTYTATGLGSAGEWPTTFGGLVSWLPGDDNFADAAGSNPGTPVGGVSFTQGQVGQAFQFDGSSGKIAIADSPSLDSSGFTVGGWFQLSQAPAAGSAADLASKYDGNYHGWILSVSNNLVLTLSVLSSPANYFFATSSTPLKLNQWYYISATFDGSTATLYINGKVVGSGSMADSYTPSSTPLVIGSASWANGDYLAGKVDEFAVYNHALTPTEINLLSTPITSDQRGGVRQAGSSVDIGATEYQYDLAVTGSASTTATPGGTITYNLTVTNKGLDPVPNITLTDTLPLGVTYQSLTVPSGWVKGPLSGQAITAASATALAPGASATFVLTAVVNKTTAAGTVLTNKVSVSPTTFDTRPGSNTLLLSTTVKAATGVDIHGQPHDALAGQSIGTVEVAVVDANGNTIPGSTSIPVRLSIYSGPKGAVLEGKTTVYSVNGVATFTNLALNEAGTYVLMATSGRLDSDFSNTIVISPANVSKDVKVQEGTVHPKHGSTKLFEQTVTISNTSKDTLHGPLALLVTHLPADVTVIGASGAYQDSRYVDLFGPAHSLAPGQKVSVTLTFLVTGLKHGEGITYTPETWLGI